MAPTYPYHPIDESPAWQLLKTERRRIVRPPSLARSISYAIEGIQFAFRHERNFRIHCVAGSLAVFLACYLRLPVPHIVLVAVLSLLVLCAELMNTAIESMLDLHAGDTFDPTVKSIKDMAAASVLVVSTGAVALGALLFLPVLVHRFAQ